MTAQSTVPRSPGSTSLFVIRNRQPGRKQLCERCHQEKLKGELVTDCRQEHKIAVFCYADGPEDEAKYPRQTHLERMAPDAILDVAHQEAVGFAVIEHKHPPLYERKCAGEELEALHRGGGKKLAAAKVGA